MLIKLFVTFTFRIISLQNPHFLSNFVLPKKKVLSFHSREPAKFWFRCTVKIITQARPDDFSALFFDDNQIYPFFFHLSFIWIKYYDYYELNGTYPLFLCLIRGGFRWVLTLSCHVYNSVRPITKGMNLIQNMNHKRKYRLNRSQEYQLQYLLSKEESFR